MKNWRIIGLLAILIIGIVLMSGCISPPRPTSAAPAATPTPQIVYVTVLVTPTTAPTIARAQYPIIGVWRCTRSNGFDERYRFNADGTYIESLYDSTSQETYVTYGTWSVQGGYSYMTRVMATGSSAMIIYDPAKNGIYDAKYPTLLLTPYQGDVMAASRSNPSTQTTRTPSEILQGHLNSGESKTITTQLRDPQTIRYTIKLVGPDSADFDLYVKKGTDVSLKNYDYKSASSKSYEQIDIFNPTVDNYNILITSNSGGGDYVLYIDYEYNTAFV